ILSPSALLRSSARLSLLRLIHTKWLESPLTVVSYPRAKSPTSGRSILMTRAPRSASCLEANGAATACSQLITVIPDKGRFWPAIPGTDVWAVVAIGPPQRVVFHGHTHHTYL